MLQRVHNDSLSKSKNPSIIAGSKQRSDARLVSLSSKSPNFGNESSRVDEQLSSLPSENGGGASSAAEEVASAVPKRGVPNTCVLLCGWMEKHSGGKSRVGFSFGNLAAKWERRWFVICEGEPLLRWFKYEVADMAHMPAGAGQHVLKGARMHVTPTEQYAKESHSFVVHNQERSLNLRAPDAEAMDDWMALLVELGVKEVQPAGKVFHTRLGRDGDQSGEARGARSGLTSTHLLEDDEHDDSHASMIEQSKGFVERREHFLAALRTSSVRQALQPPRPAMMPRPTTAVGTFLRIVTVNDVYSLENYPRLATAVQIARESAAAHDCVVTSHLNGDFLSPCMLTALDGGQAMAEALNYARVDYVCLGNHEFDVGLDGLVHKLEAYKGTVVNSNVPMEELSHLPRSVPISVGDRTVLLAGVVTDDLSKFAPANQPDVSNVLESCVATWDAAKTALGRTPDLFLPMTHQYTAEDRQMCRELAKHAELKTRTPVILAGHDHEVFVEDAGNSLIVKVGQDAEKIGLVDIWWTADGDVRSNFAMIRASEFPDDAEAMEFVEAKAQFLDDMMSVPLAHMPAKEGGCSSKTVRKGPSDAAGFLQRLVKRGLADEGVDIALIIGGCVRAGADYAACHEFTMGDLFKEFPFDLYQAVVPLPGDVLAETIKRTRNDPKIGVGRGNENYVQIDSDAACDASGMLTRVDGKPFDPKATYMVAMAQPMLTGLGKLEPMLSYAKEQLEVPDEEGCRPAKEIIVAVCMKDAWRKLIGGDEAYSRLSGIDEAASEPKAGASSLEQPPAVPASVRKGSASAKDRKASRRASTQGAMSRSSGAERRTRIKEAVNKSFAEFDEDGDGRISHAELFEALKRKMGDGSTITAGLVTNMVKVLDLNGDGAIDRSEIHAIAQF